MGSLNSGVSNGVPVNSQATGVQLLVAGDYAQIIISNAAPTEGPDNQGLVTVSGTYPPQTIAIQKVLTPSDFAAGNWTNLLGIIPRNTGLPDADGFLQLTANQTLDITLPSIQGMYAVRVFMPTSLASGEITVVGITFPATGQFSAAQLAALQGISQQLLAHTLALSDMNGTDYLSAIGGSF